MSESNRNSSKQPCMRLQGTRTRGTRAQLFANVIHQASEVCFDLLCRPRASFSSVPQFRAKHGRSARTHFRLSQHVCFYSLNLGVHHVCRVLLCVAFVFAASLERMHMPQNIDIARRNEPHPVTRRHTHGRPCASALIRRPTRVIP
jgi:hypothetical protein